MDAGSSTTTSFVHGWFQMEYVPEEGFAQLPTLFCRDHLLSVGRKVKFIDPVSNSFHVNVHRLSDKPFFTNGWKFLKDVYNLVNGAWLRFLFIDENEFFFRIYNRFMIEIVYPEHAFVYDNGIGDLPYHDISHMSDNLPSHYVSVDKVLTEKQVTSHCFTLPSIICQRITEDAEYIILRDEYDIDYECRTRGWHNFCVLRELIGGSILRFSVNETTDVSVVHVNVVSNS